MRKKENIWIILMMSLMLILLVQREETWAQTISESEQTSGWDDSVEDETTVACEVESENNPIYSFLGEIQTNPSYDTTQRAKVPETSGPRLENFNAGISYLRNAFANRQTHIEFGFYCDQPIENAGSVIKEALFAHTGNPTEGDYLKFQYRQYSVTRYLISSGTRYCYLLFMDVVYMTDQAEEHAVDATVSALLGSLKLDSMDTYEKIKTIYDWVCQNVAYDYIHVGDSTYLKQFSAYAAVVQHTAVCQGYAVLMYRLLLTCGIDARVIPGTGNGALHAWNIVALDGAYYDIDSTWDAGRSSYSYFLCSEADFVGHVRLAEYQTQSFMAAYPMSQKTYRKEIDSEETTQEPTTTEAEETTQEPTTTEAEETTQEPTTTEAEETTQEPTTTEAEETTPEPSVPTTPEGDSSSAATEPEKTTTSEQTQPDGLGLDENHIWKYYKNGEVCKTYTGLTLYYGTWYYVKDGVLDWSYTGLVLHYGTWYYVQQGCLNWNYTGLTEYYGTWYYVEKGVLNWNYTGLTQYYGTWYYVQQGRLNWNYTGLTQYYGTWYYVQQGRLNWNYTGLIQYYGTWYYVQQGRLNWNYTGLTEYYGTWYYVEKGVLNWHYNGIIYHEGVCYHVTNGVAKSR